MHATSGALLLACLAGSVLSAPPCPISIQARDCYPLQALVGMTDYSRDDFNNSESEKTEFYSRFSADPATSGAPLETTLNVPGVGPATVFLTNWFMEPRYNKILNNRPPDWREAPSRGEEHMAWLSGHGPRRVYKPQTLLSRELSAAQTVDSTNHKAVYLRFRWFFHGDVPASTVVSAASCQAAINASPVFTGTVLGVIRAAACFEP